MAQPQIVKLFTDGACRGNPGPGGYGAILQYGQKVREISGAYPLTTNNQMEMMGVIKGLSELKRACQVELTTDSKYVLDGCTRWIKGWKKNGWKTAARKPVKNVMLWRELDKLCSTHKISWFWVKGHSGHPENERVDELANIAIDAMLAGNLPVDPSLEILLNKSIE